MASESAKKGLRRSQLPQYFGSPLVRFFSQLEEHNNAQWFNHNRKTYEKEVKHPFQTLVAEMIREIKKYEPEINISAADAIFRINRDTRFSKDKSPYNAYVSANISRFGRRDKTYPGFYFRLNHKGIQVFGGAHMIEKSQLDRIRKHIIRNNARFESAINQKEFKARFRKLLGEKYKWVDADWNACSVSSRC